MCNYLYVKCDLGFLIEICLGHEEYSGNTLGVWKLYLRLNKCCLATNDFRCSRTSVFITMSISRIVK